MPAKIDKELCIGCGACEQICPQSFKLNQETGKAEVVGDGSADCVPSATDGCPTQAISNE